MISSSPDTHTGEATVDGLVHEPERQEILDQLKRITDSPLFRNSRRYPALLGYIVDEALAGRGDSLKERTLGISVFGRPNDYDTNADPVVRISAGEVRKRIAQYYHSPGHDRELRIEIPLGCYLPKFYWPSADGHGEHSQRIQMLLTAEEPAQLAASEIEPLPVAPLPVTDVSSIEPTPPQVAPRSRAALYAFLLVFVAVSGFFALRATSRSQTPRDMALFWGNILHSPEPTLIVLGIHSFDAQGNDISFRSHVSLPQTQASLLSAMTRSDMVHLSDLVSYSRITTLLTLHGHTFRTQGAADTTLEQLRQGPFVLVGGFNNLWSTSLSQSLRFRFVTLHTPRGLVNVIQDSEHPDRTWTLDVTQSALSNTRDYGLVSCFFDAETGQYMMMAGGVGKSGTEAAADFLTDEKSMASLPVKLGARSGENIQVVLATDVIEGKAGSAHVVDVYRW